MTSAGHQRPEVFSEIEALFTWNPPRLIHLPLSSSKKPSTATRPPAFYDKHFSDKLVLKRVEQLPSLVQDLAKNVDKALDAALKTLPSLDGFITTQQRERQIESLSVLVTDEKAVTNFYHQTTATYCSCVASTLALHPTASFSQWRSLLVWTQSSPSPGYAIMDGLLRFIEEGHDEKTKALRAAIVKCIESEKRLIFEKMRDSQSPLTTWEMKGASAGPVEVMTAVPNLGKFSWMTCTACIVRGCPPDPKYVREMERVKKVIVGPDAKAPPWSIPNDSLNTSLVPENRDKQIDTQLLAPHSDISSATLDTQRVTRSAARSSVSLMLPPPSPSASRSSDHGHPKKDKGKKRKRESDPSILPLSPPSASRSLEHGSPTKDKGKRRRRDDDDEAYQDRHDMTAQSLVQQAWARAVRVDGTIIVLHSGNHELVCVRHRDSQTLYVSDVIEPPTCVDPGYGKLHVGIYIAAIQDMMDRQQQQPKLPGDGGDLIGGDKDQADQDHNWGSGSGRKDGHGCRGGRHEGGHGVGKSGRFQGSAGRKGLTEELVAIEVREADEHQRTIHVASNRNVVLLYLQYSVFDSPTPASFVRSAPSIIVHTRCPTPPQEPNRTYGLEECLTIVLTSEIGRGATGVVHRGILKPEISDGAMLLDVVVKLAFTSEQRDALRSEYQVYRRLRSKGVLGGIATVLGLFDDVEDGACALVVLYAGVPLVTKPQRTLSISNCKSALSTLESIHRADILHGDIRQENILMGDLGVTIIDFGHSKQCDNQKVKDKEFARLHYLLDLTHESH